MLNVCGGCAAMIENYKSDFQSRFMSLKIEKGVSLDEIADAVGSNRSSLSRIVSGQLNLKKTLIEALANYFNVDQAYLLGESDVRRQAIFTKEWTSFMERVQANNVTLDEVEEALLIVRNLENYYHKRHR